MSPDIDQRVYTAPTRATLAVVMLVTSEVARRIRTIPSDVLVTARGGVA